MKIMKKIGVIGLGSMGMGIAQSLIKANFEVYGFDLNSKSLAILEQAGAKGVSQAANDYAESIEALIVVVVNAKQTHDVLFTSGLSKLLKPNTPIMVCSTISAKDAIEINTLLSHDGHLMLDAPLSGGAAKANTGDLTIMSSGPKAVYDLFESIFAAIAAKVYYVGAEIGQGATVKIIHQLLAGVHIAVAAEAMAMAAKANIPLELMYDVVTNAAGNSWMFENRMKHVLDGDYSPLSMVDIFVKDLGLVADTARALNFPTPLASTAFNMFTTASNCGYGKEDDSAIIKIFNDIQLPQKKEQ